MNGKFTIEETEYIRANYANSRTDAIAAHLGKNIKAVYMKAFAMKLKKSKEFLASPESGILTKGHSRGCMYQFPKGNVPHNKGKKMLPEVYEKANWNLLPFAYLPAAW